MTPTNRETTPPTSNDNSEAIERSLRTIRAYDAVRQLREALSETATRCGSGYDWNADPDSLTLKQGRAFELADKIFADLNDAVAKTDALFDDWDEQEAPTPNAGELLPCPFCGASGAFVEWADFSSCYVICYTCGARGPSSCDENDADAEASDGGECEPGERPARRFWNTRATPSPATQEHGPKCWGRTSYSDEMAHCECKPAAQDDPAKGLEALVDSAWLELSERDDRTSPEEYPEMCLIERGELAEFTDHATAERQIAELRSRVAELDKAALRWRNAFEAAQNGDAEAYAHIQKRALAAEAENKGLRDLLADIHNHAAKTVDAILRKDDRDALIHANAMNTGHPARHRALAAKEAGE